MTLKLSGGLGEVKPAHRHTGSQAMVCTLRQWRDLPGQGIMGGVTSTLSVQSTKIATRQLPRRGLSLKSFMLRPQERKGPIGMLLVSSPQRILRLLFCLAFGLGVIGLPASALATAPAPQITQPVNNQQRLALKGNVRPLPRQAQDLGEVTTASPADRLLLLLKRSPAQEADLEQFLSEVHTPGTPSYRQWLTPAQFGTRFGPADADLQAVVAWLQSEGLAVDHINPAKTAIEFSGTTAQIESAFATRLHSFEVNGEQHIANITDPQIPVALAPVVAGISPLNDFRLKPLHTAPRGRTAVPASPGTHPHVIPSAPSTSTAGAAATTSAPPTLPQSMTCLTRHSIAATPAPTSPEAASPSASPAHRTST
jgi:hypothetical protein